MKASKQILRIAALAILALFSAACKTGSVKLIGDSGAEPLIPAKESLQDYAWEDREVFRQGLIDEAQEALSGLDGASVYHLDFSISEDRLTLSGHEAVYYTNREDVPLEEVYFQLFPNHSGGKSDISAVQVAGGTVDPEYKDGGEVVRIPLPALLGVGESVVIEFDFVVEVATEMAGNYGTFGYFEEVLVLDEFYPVIPAYDQSGWNYHVPTEGDLTYLDASFYLVRVTAPADLKLVASGVVVGREISGEQQIVTFANGPARDFYMAASDKFTPVSGKVGDTIINSYAFANRKDGAEMALEITSEAMESFNQRFGTYAYTELDVVSTPMMALGIEYPGLICVTLDAYDLDSTVIGAPAAVILESATAHEVGHQWFYNTVGNDQIGEPWLDEAVVQYITGLYYDDRYGVGASQGFIDSWYDRWDRVDRRDVPIGMPSEWYQDHDYSAIVYGRGPIFMMTLAEEMGKKAFDAFLREYYQSNIWDIGTQEEFKALAEKHCDCDLTRLFGEWVDE